MKTFWIRTVSAVVYVLLFLGSMFSGVLLGNEKVGMLIFGAFLLFVTIGCSFEFFRMVRLQGACPSELLGYFYAILTLLLVMFVPLMGLKGFSVTLTAYTLFPAIFALSVILQLWHHSEQPFRDAAYTLIPLLYIALPLSLMMAVMSSHGAMVLFLLVALVWVNDSGAYIGGSLFGRHKMWERHSPGKTWEGTVFGVAVSILLAVCVGPLVTNLGWYHWFVLGVICSVVDTLGDLVESMLKRSVSVKDSGNIMPGHGGFLDRFDSLLIIMPFAYAYLTLVV